MSFEARQLRQRLEVAERRGEEAERALEAAQRQLGASANAERLRELEEQNSHLSVQVQGLKDALRKEGPLRMRKEGDDPESRLQEELEKRGKDVDTLVSQLAATKDALGRETRRADAAQRAASQLEAKVYGTVKASVPRDAVPGVSRIMVSYDDGKTVAATVPEGARPGATVDFCARALELEEKRDLERHLAKKTALLEDTADDLGKAMDAKRRVEKKADASLARAAAAEAKFIEGHRRWFLAERTRSAVEAASLVLRRNLDATALARSNEVDAFRRELEASRAKVQALELRCSSLEATHHAQLQRTIADADARAKAHSKKAAALVKDLKAELNRERRARAADVAKLHVLERHKVAVAPMTLLEDDDDDDDGRHDGDKDLKEGDHKWGGDDDPKDTKPPETEASTKAPETEASTKPSAPPKLNNALEFLAGSFQNLTRKEPPPPAPPAVVDPCATCKLLATRLEGLLSENVRGRERIAFLEGSIQDLHADVKKLQDGATATVQVRSDGTVSI